MRFCSLLLLTGLTCGAATPVGIFEDHADIGAVLHPGSAQFDKAKGAYVISGSGENMWSTADEYHYVWKKVSGDVSIAADIAFTTEGGDPHKKAMLVMRQSLDPASAYVDAAFHGNGLTSLQWRETSGVATHEVQSNISAPKRVRLEKLDGYFYLSVSADSEDPHFTGASVRIALSDPFYIGIGVCAHNKESIQTADFSSIAITTPKPRNPVTRYATHESVAVASTDRWVVTVSDVPHGKVAAPSGEAASAKEDPAPETADGFINRFARVSPDGTRVAFLSFRNGSNTANEFSDASLRVMLLSDKSVRTLAKFIAGPHSFDAPAWSPDGKNLAFVSYQIR